MESKPDYRESAQIILKKALEADSKLSDKIDSFYADMSNVFIP
jgi:hypothetical protein